MVLLVVQAQRAQPQRKRLGDHHWKTTTADAYGNAIQVAEPNPAGGANLTTNYTYTPLNQITGVSMTRGNVAQTRTFLYSGIDLVKLLSAKGIGKHKAAPEAPSSPTSRRF